MEVLEQEFKKYNSIENTYREAFVNKIFSQYLSANHIGKQFKAIIGFLELMISFIIMLTI